MAYQVQYPSTGEPALAEKVQQALQRAAIPTLQLSLVNNLDAKQHLAIANKVMFAANIMSSRLSCIFN